MLKFPSFLSDAQVDVLAELHERDRQERDEASGCGHGDGQHGAAWR